jgi:hypothetical protein
MNAFAEVPLDTDSTVHAQPKHSAGVPRSNRTWLREAADLQVPLVKGDVLLVR